MPDPAEVPTEDSTVDDWFGQNVARDQEVANALVSEHPRPDDDTDLSHGGA